MPQYYYSSYKNGTWLFFSEKSSVTLFTPQPNQACEHPQISINGTTVPLEKQPNLKSVALPVHEITVITFGVGCANPALDKGEAVGGWGRYSSKEHW